MTETAPATSPEVAAARTAAETAQQAGDTGAANRAYAAELAARAGAPAPAAATPPGTQVATTSPRGDSRSESAGHPTIASHLGTSVTVEPWSAPDTDSAFTVMSAFDKWPGANSRELRSRWGGDAAANVGYATAYGEANPDVVAILARYGLTGHPAAIEIGAVLGRRAAHAAPRTPTAQPQAQRPTMSATDRDSYDAAIEDIRKQQEQAYQERKGSVVANKLYMREQELIRQRDGSGEIVNGRRTA